MEDPFAGQLIAVAIDALRRFVVPALDDPAARLQADLATRVLRHAAFRIGEGEAARARLAEGETMLAGRLDRLLIERGGCDDARAGSDRMPDLVRACAEGEDRLAATDLLEAIVANRQRYFALQDPEIVEGSAAVYRGGRIDREDLPSLTAGPRITHETVTEYLRARTQDPRARITRFTVALGGFSKTTILCRLERDGRDPLDLAIRQDMAVPLSGLTVVNEYPLLFRLHAIGMPVAEPLWLEPGGARFGGAFMVSRMVPGKADVALWSSDPAQCEAVSRGLAEVLARLHAIDIADLAPDHPDRALSAGDGVAREIACWRERLTLDRVGEDPLLDMLFAWLSANVPSYAHDRPARIVHGDVGFHNLLVEDGAVRALLDWEYAHMGDPAADLAYVKPFITQIFDWQRFIDFYRAAGGDPPPAEALEFYALWAHARNGVGATGAAKLFLGPYAGHIKYAVSGYVFRPYVQLAGAQALVETIRARNAERERR